MQKQDFQLFEYKAVNERGKVSTGYLTASSEIALSNKLRELNLDLIKAKVKKPSSGIKFLQPKVQLRDKLQLFVQLQQMTQAGISILDCFDNCIYNTKNLFLRDKILEIKTFVSDGMKVSEAMRQFPAIFNKVEIAIMQAGEETGDMAASYGFIIEYLKNDDLIRRKLKKATRYPMIVTVVVLFAIVILLGFVVPEVVSFLLVIDGGEIPFTTTALIATSNFVQQSWWIIIGALVISGVVISALKKSSSEFHYKADEVVLKMPVVGELLRKIEISRFAYVFSVLYTAGLPVVTIMDQAKNVCSNKVLYGALEDASENIRNGMSISEGLNQTGQFPSMVIQMFLVGEESGNISPVLTQICEYYNNDVDEAIDAFIATIEPGLTAFLGILIIWIAVAVFGPIYGMFENLNI